MTVSDSLLAVDQLISVDVKRPSALHVIFNFPALVFPHFWRLSEFVPSKKKKQIFQEKETVELKREKVVKWKSISLWKLL